jgi:hypothetical protein
MYLFSWSIRICSFYTGSTLPVIGETMQTIHNYKLQTPLLWAWHSKWPACNITSVHTVWYLSSSPSSVSLASSCQLSMESNISGFICSCLKTWICWMRKYCFSKTDKYIAQVICFLLYIRKLYMFVNLHRTWFVLVSMKLGLVRISGLWDVEAHCMARPVTCLMSVSFF